MKTLFFLLFLLPTTLQADILKAYSLLKEKTLEKSYDIQSARATYHQRQAQIFTAWTHWLPHVELQTSQMLGRDFSILSSGNLGPLANTLSPQVYSLKRAELALYFPLYKRSIHVGITHSLNEKEVAANDFDLKKSELDWRLSALLGDYLLQKYKEATLENSIQIAKTNLKEAELRFELGSRTKIDLLRAKANLFSLDSKKSSTQSQRESSLHALLEYTGLTFEEFKETEVEKISQNEAFLFESIDALTQTQSALEILKPLLRENAPQEKQMLEKKMVESSPTYHHLLFQNELALSQAALLTSNEWPELSLRGSLNKQSPNWNEVFTSPQRSYSLAVVLTLPLFSGGSLVSSHLEKHFANQASEFQVQKEILKLKNEIENEREQIQTLLSTVSAQKLSLAQNEEIVRLSFKSYQLGKATMLELLSSQNDLIDSKVNLAKTKIDLSILVKRFAWNLGVPTP